MPLTEAQLDELRAEGARITRFETFTGGLVAPECDDNPWRYKFTWNPRNVVLPGQGVVKFKHNGMRHNLESKQKTAKKRNIKTGILREEDARHVRRLLRGG